jgi:hypothetical protein
LIDFLIPIFDDEGAVVFITGKAGDFTDFFEITGEPEAEREKGASVLRDDLFGVDEPIIFIDFLTATTGEYVLITFFGAAVFINGDFIGTEVDFTGVTGVFRTFTGSSIRK